MASQLDKLMDVRGLTLRSKSRRRPQISAPQPIAGPTPSERRPSAAPSGSGATSDLVKRRYSARFNQVPDSALDAPPVPSLPSDLQAYNNQDAPSSNNNALQQAGTGAPLEVDLKALKDPSLPVEKCMESHLFYFQFNCLSFGLLIIPVDRCGRITRQRFGRGDSRLSTKLTTGEKSYFDRFAAKCVPKPDTIHQDQ